MREEGAETKGRGEGRWFGFGWGLGVEREEPEEGGSVWKRGSGREERGEGMVGVWVLVWVGVWFGGDLGAVREGRERFWGGWLGFGFGIGKEAGVTVVCGWVQFCVGVGGWGCGHGFWDGRGRWFGFGEEEGGGLVLVDEKGMERTMVWWGCYRDSPAGSG
ncbi:uncharacterized protein G2W53_026906 [Senna tora]|uniref:Uncharacterized protein n=1 Tax=Senna tora TaxID=362788 RepID=A0A834WJ82_9FABA|nr:uncharacterized protein G2W53_026906 [Senna tora]